VRGGSRAVIHPASLSTKKREMNMQITNGAYDESKNLGNHDLREEEAAPAAPKNPPAQTFLHGAVETRIWANPTHWGAVTFKVDQVRGRKKSKSLYLDDLRDAERGLYEARGWIKRAERALRRRRFPWGWF
jgi:hypothetical protein